jgi:hypothetical protein
MLRTAILATVALAIGAATVLGASQRRGANQQSQPDFGTGTVTVTIANEPGVIVTNEPTVVARQAGPWTVSLSDQPLLISTAPDFLQTGATYTFNWPDGLSEEHQVVAVGNNGWVRVDTEDHRAKWLDSSLAVSIEASARQR